MHVLGLHIFDVAIITLFLIGLLVMGALLSRSIKGESDFFVGGRNLGGWMQFFLNFGMMSDSNGAPTVATEVARQGVGGMWISFQMLFCTPFYWFSSIWFRRTRVMTVGDLFADRFASRGLALCYALLQIIISTLLLGMGNVISYKVSSALVVKAESEWSPVEQRSVEGFREFQALAAQASAGTLPAEAGERYQALTALSRRGELHSYISWLQPTWFSVVYALVVAVYIMLGGLRAAAITDAVQGVLIVVFSVVMIPIGLARVGGFTGLHRLVPEDKFALFGSAAMSEYTWYSIGAMFFVVLVVTPGAAGSIGPSAAAGRNERALRVGSLGGAFVKRFVVIAWMLCGLLVAALFPAGLADPDNAWGVLAVTLLAPGLLGLMISGMILGHMPLVGFNAVSASALFTRNIYEPLLPGRTPAHYLRVAKLCIPAVLAASVLIGLFFANVISLLSTIVTFTTLFGGICFLLFFWRRLRPPAIYATMAVHLVVIGLMPWLLPQFAAFRRCPALVEESAPRSVSVAGVATSADVQAGRAAFIGERIARTRVIAPVAVFFEKVARSDPADPALPQEGIGRFVIENWLLSKFGVPVAEFGPAGLTTCRWTFDACFPYTLLLLLSALCCGRDSPNERAQRARDDRFFAKTKTPIGATPESDAQAVAASQADPRRFDHIKLFPRSSWEFTVWTRSDWMGFGFGWAMVAVVLLTLWVVVTIGA